MKKKEVFLTSEGYLELENELHYLKTEKRKEVTQTLKEARALGDLSENSEYDQAREDQSNLEKRIVEIEYTLEHATVIDEVKDDGTVGVGCQVELKYEDDDDVESYKIVGSQEADPFNNKISNESPIAAAIIGKKVGDTVEVSSPDGVYSVKIVAIG
ncbi:MAG: transcription elongation factor GreA [Clostridium sp.]|nr:MAG: transcription elongation factor GreA [Clostridium sp.]